MNDTRLPNNDEVICPNCCHQFRAIPVNAQTRIAELEAAAQVDKTPNPQGRLVDKTVDLQARIAELEAALADAEKDAARYRWLRENARLFCDWNLQPESKGNVSFDGSGRVSVPVASIVDSPRVQEQVRDVRAIEESQIAKKLIAASRSAMAVARMIVGEQAEDEGLWFDAQTTPEAYLQQALRRLHAAVEGER